MQDWLRSESIIMMAARPLHNTHARATSPPKCRLLLENTQPTFAFILIVVCLCSFVKARLVQQFSGNICCRKSSFVKESQGK